MPAYVSPGPRRPELHAADYRRVGARRLRPTVAARSAVAVLPVHRKGAADDRAAGRLIGARRRRCRPVVADQSDRHGRGQAALLS